jgi:hypothetical protein
VDRAGEKVLDSMAKPAMATRGFSVWVEEFSQENREIESKAINKYLMLVLDNDC